MANIIALTGPLDQYMLLVIALVAAPRAQGQYCVTSFSPSATCSNGADEECCNLLRELTDPWNGHVETKWCVCMGLQAGGIPGSRLNECGVVEGSDPIC